MKRALISPTEISELGMRVADVADVDFETAEPLYWVDCPIDIDNTYWLDINTGVFAKPVILPRPTNAQPSSTLEVI